MLGSLDEQLAELRQVWLELWKRPLAERPVFGVCWRPVSYLRRLAVSERGLPRRAALSPGRLRRAASLLVTADLLAQRHPEGGWQRLEPGPRRWAMAAWGPSVPRLSYADRWAACVECRCPMAF